MAKNPEDDFGDLDDLGLDDDLDMFNDNEDSFSEKPKKGRDAVLSSVKDGFDGFKSGLTDDAMKTATDIADKAIPPGLSKEKLDVEDAVSTLKEEILNATKEIRQAGSTTLTAVDKLIPEGAFLKKYSGKLLSYLNNEDTSGAIEEISKEQRQTTEINQNILETLGEQTNLERQSMAIKEQISASRHKSTQELLATILVNTDKHREFNNTIVNSYYRRSLELQYKSLFTSREQLEVIKSGFTGFTNQFESIIKNTGLPDIVKIKSTEQLSESISSKTRDSIAEFVNNDLNPFNTFKENATSKIKSFKDHILETLGAGGEVADGLGMMQEMESFGMSKANVGGGLLADWIKGKVGEKISDKIEDSEKGKDYIYKIKNNFLNPEKFLLDQADKQDTETTLGSAKNSFFNTAASLFNKKDKKDLLTLTKKDPDDPAIFDYRIHDTIVKTIPGLLSKIYGEVKGIRTGENPEDNDLHFDRASDKFKTTKTIKKDFQDKATKILSNNIGQPMLSFISRLVPKGKRLNPNDEQTLASGLLQYLLETKNVAPDALLNSDKNLLTYLPKSLRKVTGEYLEELLKEARDKPYMLDSVAGDLSRILKGIPTFGKSATELYKNGLKSVGEDFGILNTDNVTGKTVLDREGVNNFVLDTFNKNGMSNLRDDLEKRNTFNAKYNIKSQDDIAMAEEKLAEERRKNKKSKKTIEDFLKEQTTNLKSSEAYKYTSSKITEFDNEYGISNKANEYYNTELNKLADKVSEDISKKISSNEYLKSIRTKTENSKIYQEGKSKLEELDKKYKISKKTKVKLKRLTKNIKDSELAKTVNAEIDKISNLEELKNLNTFIEENSTIKSVKETIDNTVNKSLSKNVDDVTKKSNQIIRRQRRKLNLAKIKLANSDAKKDIDMLLEQSDNDITKIPDLIVKNGLHTKYKNQTEELMESVKNNIEDKKNQAEEKINFILGDNKSEMRKYNIGNLTPDKIQEVNRLKPSNNPFIKGLELKELTPEQENDFRIMYLNSSVDRDKVSFEDYVKTFGYKPDGSLINKFNFVKGIKNLFDKQYKKDVIDKNVDKVIEHAKLKKVSGSEEDALRFEFYNSPEYKDGLVKDFPTWLKDKGLRNDSIFSIKNILKKTREWDKKIFNATVGTAYKGIKNIPWAAKNSLKLGAKAIKPFTTLGKYAADGLLSTVGLDFMGIGDKGTRKLDKKILKESVNAAKNAPKGIAKLSSMFKSGAEKVSGLNWGLLNPFSSLKEEDINAEKFMKKHQKKMEKKNKKAKVENSKPEKAYNDSDGDGLRDGDWRSRFNLFKKKKEAGPALPKEEKKDDGLGDLLKLLGLAIPGLLSVGKNMLSTLLGVPKLLKWIGKGIFKIPSMLKSIGSGIMKIPSLIGKVFTGGASMLGLGAEAGAVGASTGIMGKVGNAISNGAKAVGNLVSSITPESIKLFFGKIKDQIIKKLGPKAGGKLMLVFGAKTASRLVPIAGAALLAYDVAMITHDMISNGTDFKSAVSKQLLGFDIFNPDEPALDEDGNPIKPDEKFTKEDMAEKLSDKEKEKLSDNNGNNVTEKDWFDKMTDSVKSASSTVYDKAKEMGSSAVDYTKNAYNAVSDKVSQVYTDTKDVVSKAYDSTKKALGGLVGSIPLPNGSGTWKALKETIMSASKAAGVDEKLMAIMAAIESGFDYTVKAGTSSAKGLYQFLDGTWSSMVKQFGGKYGIDPSTPATDPRANALMGAEFLKQNAETLKSSISRPLTYTDLYLAHFLGPAGAKKFIKEMEKDGNQSAALLFPGPAASNSTIFYVGGDKSKPRSLNAIYSHFTNLLDKKSKAFNIDIVNSDGSNSTQQTNPDAIATTNTNVPNTPSSNSPAENVVSGNDVNVNAPNVNKTTTQPQDSINKNTTSPTTPTVNTSSNTNGGLGSYTDKANLSNTENIMTNNNISNESSKTLNTISNTLSESLKVQIRIADALDKISSFDTKNKTLSKEEISAANNKDAVNTASNKPVNNDYQFPNPVISLERKTY